MTQPERVAYRTSDAFATTLYEFMERHNAARLAAHEYNQAHPDHPLHVVRSHLDHAVTVAGFVDVHPHQPAPRGLSRAQDRDYLIPARGGAGTPWRAVRDEFNRFPSLAEEVFKRHGLQVARLGDDFRYNVAGVHDFGEHGAFVTMPGGYEEPGEHLTPVLLSEFYRAKELHEAAQAVAS